MHASDFHFDLPDELIASAPLPERTASRLLELDGRDGAITDRHFTDLPELISEGDLVILNDTRVIPARLYGRKASGGRVEVLVERIEGEREALAQLRASHAPRPGTRLELEGDARAEVVCREGEFFRLRFEGAMPLLDLLEATGHMPLPPYIQREDDADDRARYQTVFATEPGAVAAPTAGLHFDDGMLERLEAQGVGIARLTLHVGAGTFQPVRVERLEDHRMHSERVSVSEDVCRRVRETRAAGGRVIAVGTTVVRALETAAASGELEPYAGETDIFIYPGYHFRVVDALLTNFHLPGSTLIMLVSAFAGRENVLAAYRHAVAERYRFFSYGDAMFIPRAAPDAAP